MLLKNLTKKISKKTKNLKLVATTQKREFGRRKISSHLYMHQPESIPKSRNVTLIPGVSIGPEITSKFLLF